MSIVTIGPVRDLEPIRAEPLPNAPSSTGLVQRLGRLRVPLTLSVRPWATLYRLPDGRLLFCLRLWEQTEALPRCLSPSSLRTYALESRLDRLVAEIDALLARALVPRGP